MKPLSISFACSLILIGAALWVEDSIAQLTSNVFTRVLMIKVGNDVGTAFTLDIDGRQYLITAKHVVEHLKEEGPIELFRENQWSKTSVKVLRCNDPIDIAVLVPPRQLTLTYTLEPNTDRFLFGQDAYFVGFPYALWMTGKNINGLYPFPLLKKGVISAIVREDETPVILLDGHNNPGFSGGPIVYRDLNQSQVTFYLAGVVSGFRHEYVPVLHPEELQITGDTANIESWRIMKSKEGKHIILKDTPLLAKLNTGIVRGYLIHCAIDLIRKNPIGPKIGN